MAIRVKSNTQIKAGDYYEDCFYHPCLCIFVEPDGADAGDDIRGISLIDGSWPRGCSLRHCGVRKLTFEEAITWKLYGPQDPPDGVTFDGREGGWVTEEQKVQAQSYWPKPEKLAAPNRASDGGPDAKSHVDANDR